MSVAAVVLAAGKGRRFRSKVPKPFVRLGKRPVLVHSLEAFRREPGIREMIVVVSPGTMRAARSLLARCGLAEAKVVSGGARRQDSVANALKALGPCSDYVLIHDAARPLIGVALVRKLIREARSSGAACLAVPVKATIKSVKRAGMRFVVVKTLDRKALWEVQTPQVFSTGLLREAYRRYGRQAVTDDASLVERLGHPVTVVEGSYSNIKITTPEDLAIAEALLKRKI
jgi:2-C-methyl-D-erythritol 4-phosphate cytidylyltransferase